ncbi:MAG TPA: serine hydrolase [Clostridia bacterium]|nr:serine hydrolase [Clostridia bacterium]
MVVKKSLKLDRAAYPEDVGVSSAKIAEFLEDLDKSDIEVHSIMVLREGKVAFEFWHKPYAAHIPHTMYSVSKSFTSAAVGFAVDEGLITVNTKVIDIFPEYRPIQPGENLEKLTVFHLLTMTAGKDVSFLADKTKNQWIKDFFDAKWAFAPGERWRYISENTYMLCAILHRVTGMSVIDYLMPRLFEPLGIERPFWETDGNGVEAGGWGLFIKTEDFAKFMLCYSQGGKFDGKQIIPERWAKDSVKALVDNEEYDAMDCRSGYGYCFWRNHGCPNSYRADGMFSQFGIVFEDYNAVFIFTSSEVFEQKARDCIWRHFPDAFIEPKSEPYADQSLKKRLTLPPLPELQKTARSYATERRIESKIIRMRKPFAINEIGYPVSMMPLAVFYMSADKAGNIDYIRFRFDEATCKMSWSEGKERNTILCGMDGVARRCKITLGGIDFTVTCTAAWKNENTLEVWVRPLESIAQRRLTFIFAGNRVRMILRSSPELKRISENIAESCAEMFDNPMLIKLFQLILEKGHGILEPTHRGQIM